MIPQYQDPSWLFIGDNGLRVGWSVLLFAILFNIFKFAAGFAFFELHLIDQTSEFTAGSMLLEELVPFLALLGAAALVCVIEERRIMDLNLDGPRRTLLFFSGLAAGGAALSTLVASLALGGWLRFGPIALSATESFKLGALWACAFLLVALVEEGLFRCYALSTLTRGLNFWWALGAIATVCALSMITGGNGALGVYLFAILGLAPCLWLHVKAIEGSGFWYAAWVTSTTFGYWHISNRGESWIGIAAAAAIGFVFCVSIRVTRSVWWAIGCHAAWDWAETFFYGTADSGLAASGHYLTTSPRGAALWSGGDVGPEGSILVLGVILALLVALLMIYGRKRLGADASVVATGLSC
jgi:membrane protease YdiL (CAAX protease family)